MAIYSWSKNLASLQKDAEKLHQDLSELGSDIGAEGGKRGGGPARRDPVIVLVEKIKREIDERFNKGIKRVSGLPKNMSYGKQQGEADQVWKNEYYKVSELVSQIHLTGETGGETDTAGRLEMLTKLLDVKDYFCN